jgi:hypothetical protein
MLDSVLSATARAKPPGEGDFVNCELGKSGALPGLIAWLDYLQKLGSEFEAEWMMTDRTCAAVLVDSFVTSLKQVGVRA